MQGDALVRDQYTRMAHIYEERVVPRFAPIAARTVALAELQEGQRVLDVGCGTGLATLLAAEHVGPKGEVVGVDFSEGQLGIAAGKAQLRGLGHVQFERADATQLAFEAAFDAAISNLGIPAEFAPTFAGMQRALRPGGRLSVTEWARPQAEPFDTFRALLAEHLDPHPPPDIVEARAVLARRRAMFDRIGTVEGFEAALRAAGFAEVRVAPASYDVPFRSGREAYDVVLSWGWQEQEVRRLPAPARASLQEGMERRFGAAPFTARWHLLHGTAQRG
ncbi:MAG TPA: methyltransferase domain-containing protein [Candidatus Thermoplasmatota archaeon]|jgi:ubiquinone/menaquinone biosynthesis C-methylase UbiE|nr:methyltransferase domain-containing protein [Candidatus Thermoplasmatota archaeon]